MSRVLIIAVGSRGDVAPLTGVGVALRHAGHDVSIAAFTPFAESSSAAVDWVFTIFPLRSPRPTRAAKRRR